MLAVRVVKTHSSDKSAEADMTERMVFRSTLKRGRSAESCELTLFCRRNQMMRAKRALLVEIETVILLTEWERHVSVCISLSRNCSDPERHVATA